jgi:hypothetical protein
MSVPKFLLAIVTTTATAVATIAVEPPRAHLPISKQANDRIGGGNWVEVSAKLSDGSPPRIDGTITCRNYVFASGFVGTAVLKAYDEKGNVIGGWGLPSIGVNGEVFGGSKRSKTFTFEVPPALGDRCRSLGVECMYANNPTLEEKIRDLKRLLEALKK